MSRNDFSTYLIANYRKIRNRQCHTILYCSLPFQITQPATQLSSPEDKAIMDSLEEPVTLL